MLEAWVCLLILCGVVLLLTLIVSLLSPAGEAELNLRANPFIRPLLWLAAIPFLASGVYGPTILKLIVVLVSFVCLGAMLEAMRRRIRRFEESMANTGQRHGPRSADQPDG